jgi:hypothetical protein
MWILNDRADNVARGQSKYCQDAEGAGYRCHRKAYANLGTEFRASVHDVTLRVERFMGTTTLAL